MLTVARPQPHVLVVSQRPAGVALRLAIWNGVVLIFYLVVLTELMPADDAPRGWREWLLLLFPLFLLPYLIGLVRALRRADELIFDAASQILSNRSGNLAAFADIRELRLRTVHGSCEEFRLSAALEDGSEIRLVDGQASAALEKLAAEVAAFTGIELTRST